MSPRHYLALSALAAALSLLPACTTTHGQQGTTPATSENGASGEPDLLQTLRDRIAHGVHKSRPKAPAATEASTAATDTSRASALTAGNQVLTPAQQKELVAVGPDYDKALKLMHDGQDDQALTLLQSIVKRAPDFSGPVVNQGLILLKQQQYDRAGRVFKQAIAINPKSAYAYNMLGITQRDQGKFADAKASYESALAIDPNYARAHFNLGVLADLYMQDLPLAISNYQAYQALQCKPDKAVANWIVDLQRRSGTYVAPQPGALSPAPPAGVDCTAPAALASSGAPAATATSGTPAATATTGTMQAATPSTANAAPAASATSAAPVATATSGKLPAATPSTANAAPASSATSATPTPLPAPTTPAKPTASKGA